MHATPSGELKVLHIGDTPGASAVFALLQEGELADAAVSPARGLDEAIAKLRESHFDVILLSVSPDEGNVIEAFARIQAASFGAPILVLAGIQDEQLASRAMRAGAQDYLVTGQFDSRQLCRAVKYAIERKQAEARIHWLTLALDQCPSSVILTDPRGAIEFVNRKFTEVTGYSSAEVIGHNPRILKSGETPSSVYKSLWETVLKGETWRGELKNRRKNGEVYPVSASISPVRDERGAITHYVGVQEDITRARRSEAALRASEARFRMLFDTIPLPTYVVDSETQRFLEVNEAAVRSYGWSREEMLRMTGRDIRPPDEVPRYLQSLAGRTSATSDFGIWKHQRKDGTTFDADVIGYDLRFGDRNVRLVVAQDVSERRHLEAQLHQSQKIEAVGRLAGGVAHDFNNLLAVILSYSGLLLKDVPKGDPMRADLEEIAKAGERAAGLTRQLLAFSRRQVLDPRPVDLNEIITQMDKMLRRLIGEDIGFTTLPSPNPGTVSVDPGQMEQVIMNLVVNARDAMPQGGKLTIETVPVDVDEALARQYLGLKPGPHVMLAVSDTGTGMDPATQMRIFEPFFTTKEKGRGTGLGLSTVFGIVKQSGGSIYVSSELGKGTTFKLYFPCIGQHAVAVDRGEAPVSKVRGTETILLVEDEDQVRNAVREVLRRNGYRVIEAKNAGEALLTCEGPAEAISLMLTDVVMPQMSGPEVARRLLRVRPNMKVLCMSGYNDEAIANHGYLGSGIAFIQKPFTPDALAKKIRSVLDATP
jgi:two-component system, cell cycle sensor histidine kinase and response regulator CckA